jgi:hypothetical protein
MKDDLPDLNGLASELRRTMVEGRAGECSSQRLLHYARTRGNDLEKNYEVSLYSFRLARFRYLGLPGKS